jgi:hypothetical protein
MKPLSVAKFQTTHTPTSFSQGHEAHAQHRPMEITKVPEVQNTKAPVPLEPSDFELEGNSRFGNTMERLDKVAAKILLCCLLGGVADSCPGDDLATYKAAPKWRPHHFYLVNMAYFNVPGKLSIETPLERSARHLCPTLPGLGSREDELGLGKSSRASAWRGTLGAKSLGPVSTRWRAAMRAVLIMIA